VDAGGVAANWNGAGGYTDGRQPARDATERRSDIMAASQRPAALATLNEPSGPPAWKAIPSWYLVAGADNTIGTANLRFMADRIGAKTVEVKGTSHVVMMSHPRRTTKLVLAAARGAA
jgi:pimeloyl-ACP methyl ester carboxylesterase